METLTASTPDRRLVAIEGLPGSGHTEFARWIGDQPGWYAACGDETVSLPGVSRSSLLSPLLQILLNRREWSLGLVGTDMFRERIVTDYVFETHSLWARALLEERDWALYKKIAAVIPAPAVSPDLVVYLQPPEEESIELLRVIDRGIGSDSWRELVRSFNHHFFAYDSTPLLVVRTGSAEWHHSTTARAALLQRILQIRGAKTYLMGEAGLWSGGHPAAD